MAHSKSAKKRVITAERNRMRNQSVKSRVKTFSKKVETLVEANNAVSAAEALAAAYKELDKAVSKGIIHKNAAARKKSRLSLKVNAVNA